jgi:histidinol-phosphate phosphatase family protein
MIQKGLPLYGYFTDEYVKDMGTPERLEKVRKDFMAGRILKRKAVFIDRDGVLNEEVDIVYKPSQLKLIRGSAEAVKMLRESGYLVIAVTNQPVVARGMVTEDDIAVIHARLSGMLAKKGSKLDAIYYCPHHPDKGYHGENPKYKIECECRKPKPGMIMKAAADFCVEPRSSYMVGDSTRDILAGKNAGCETILVRTGFAGKDGKYKAKPDHVCDDLLSAAKLIIKAHKAR